MLAPYLSQAGMPDQVHLCFRFQINGTSAPDNCFPAGAVKSVGRTSAGLFTVVMNDGFRPAAMTGLVGGVLEATQAHDLLVKSSVAGYAASTGVLTVTVVGADGSTSAEDPVDNDWVYLDVCFQTRTSTAAVGAI